MGFFSAFQKSKVDTKWDLNYGTPNHIYRSDAPNVQGTVSIKGKNEISEVISINVGLKGYVHNYYLYVYHIYNRTRRRRQRRIKAFTADHELFDQRIKLADNEMATISQGIEYLSKDIHFCFPTNLDLPSSCHKLGHVGDNEGYSSVIYQLYVEVVTRGRIIGESTSKSVFEVKYQGSREEPVNDIESIESVDQLYKKKLKKQIYDQDQKSMVPTPLEDSHRHTRKIRQIWNSNYSDDTYNDLAQDVSLKCSFIFKNNFNLALPLNELLRLRFTVPMKDPSNFQVTGNSTGLGEFVIKELHLKLKHHVRLKVDRFMYDTVIKKDLFIIKIPDGGYKIDVTEFIPSKTDATFNLDVSMEDILGRKSTISLMDELVEPVTCDYTIAAFSQALTQLRFSLHVGTSQQNDDHIHKFKVDTEATVTYFKHLPAYQNEHISEGSSEKADPPPYAP